MAKKIAIVGRGHVGGALSRGLSRAGHELIAVGKDERAIRDVAEWADLVILAVPFAAVAEVAQIIEPVTAGKPIVDVTNALNEHAGLAIGFTTSGGEELQKKLPRASVVKALDTVFAGLMETGQVEGQPLTAFVAGDDDAARSTVMELVRDIRLGCGELGVAQERASARAAWSAQHPTGLLPWLRIPGRVPAPARRRRGRERKGGPMNQVAIDRVESDVLLIRLAGRWELRNGLASAAPLKPSYGGSRPRRESRSTPRTGCLGQQHPGLSRPGQRHLPRTRLALDATALLTGLHNLLDLAVAVPERAGARKEFSTPPFLERLGAHALAVVDEGGETLSFLGNMTLASIRLVRRKARYRAVRPLVADPAVRHRGAADRDPDQLPGRGHPRVRRRGPAQAVRRADLCRRPRRHRDGPRDGRDDERHHHGGPHRRRVRGRARHHEGDRGDRRADDRWAFRSDEFLVLPRMLALV